MLLNSKKVFAI